VLGGALGVLGVHLQIFPVNYAWKIFLRPGVQVHPLHPLATPMASRAKNLLTPTFAFVILCVTYMKMNMGRLWLGLPQFRKLHASWSRSGNYLKDSSNEIAYGIFPQSGSHLWKNWSKLWENFIIDVRLDKEVPLNFGCHRDPALQIQTPDSDPTWLHGDPCFSRAQGSKCFLLYDARRKLLQWKYLEFSSCCGENSARTSF